MKLIINSHRIGIFVQSTLNFQFITNIRNWFLYFYWQQSVSLYFLIIQILKSVDFVSFHVMPEGVET